MNRNLLLPRVREVAFVLMLGTLGARAEDNTTNIYNSITNDLNSGTYVLGASGNNNALIISQSGALFDGLGTIGDGSNNSALVVGAGSIWSNSLNLNIGANLSINNSLIVSNGGRLVCASENIGVYSKPDGGIGQIGAPAHKGGDNNEQRIIGSGSVARISADLNVGVGQMGVPFSLGVLAGDFNRVTILAGGLLCSSNGNLGVGGCGNVYTSGQLYYGGGPGGGGGSSNQVTISGVASIWNNSADLQIGVAGTGNGAGGGGQDNSVLATNGGVVQVGGCVKVGSWNSGINSQLIAVDGGQILVTNRSGTGTIDIQNGCLLVNGGVVAANKLCVTNGTSSVLQFPAGLLDVGAANVADGVPFVVGDGVSSATLRLRGGTSYFADGLIISSNAVLLGTGTIYGDVKVYGTKAATLNIVPGMGGTLNATDLTWHTGGDASWFRQTATTHDGGAALRSGAISAGQQTWFQTTTNGPGSLIFWWKVSSAANNYLQFYIGTQLVSQISGNVDWNQYVGFIGTTNPVTLTWVYTNSTGAAAGSNAGFVDQVTWIPSLYATNAPQVFYQDPGNLIASWVLNSTGGVDTVRLLGLTPGWPIKAAGDIDGDGVSDLIFQSSGVVAVWFMNADGSVRGGKVIGDAGAWEVRGCGDFFGTGRAQLFFQSGSTAAYWQMDTNASIQTAGLYPGLGSWQLRGVGRAASANQGEAFFLNAGSMCTWFRNSSTSNIVAVLDRANPALPVSAANPLYNVGAWQLGGVVDIDGDGTSDLLWQAPDSWTGGWFMQTNGTARDARGWWTTGTWKLRAAGR
jgi:hypothetical protein